MRARDENAEAALRDLPPTGGRLARLHLRAGQLLIRLAGIARPELTLGVRLLALDPDGRVFLVRHSYLPGWHLPGGGVDLGETTREAALREAAEEGGLVFDAPPRLFHIYHHAAGRGSDHKVLYLAKGARQRPDAGGGLEIRASGFFDAATLPEETTRATRARLAEALGGAAPSDRW